ncbi:MAG: ATPase [Flavobacteriales bacterium]|nr:ATPase [Flavobacteriales bacterium]
MKKTLLRTVLRREVVALTRVGVIVLSIFLILLEFGYQSDGSTERLLDEVSYDLVVAAAFVMLGSLLRLWLRKQTVRRAEVVWLLAAVALILIRPLHTALWDDLGRWPHMTFLILFIFIELSRLELGRNSTLLNPALLFTASFILIITIGAALISLPKMTTRPVTLIDALFTSTSAVCVTGLTVLDVQHDLTHAGQWLLMVLIQLGGLGVMTFTSFFAFFFKGRTSLEEQLRIRDLSNTSLSGARGFVVRVILFTLSVELVGALFIFYSVPRSMFATIGDRAFFSMFHAISAFNNAGFSTLTDGLHEPVLRFNYALMWIIASLVIFGGLGFGIIFNFSQYVRSWFRARVKKLFTGVPCQRYPRLVNLSSKLALISTLALIVIGTVAMLLFERDGVLQEHNGWWARISVAFFSGITPRTAGFNVVNTGALHVPTLMITLLLMYIGASPGSTGGGIKTTTFAIATLNIFGSARGRKRIEYGGREVSNVSVRRAFATIVLSLIFLGISVTVVSSLEHGLGLLPVAFECFSAYGTVGLSMGITGELSEAARLVLVVVMFVGRVSALTLLVGVLRQVQSSNYRYPKEDILIN